MVTEHIREEAPENPIRIECRRICNQELRTVLTDHVLPLKELPNLVESAADVLVGSKKLEETLGKPDPHQKKFRELADECLERTLKKSHGIDLEKWREEHRRGNGVAGPTNEEQLQRNKNLTDFISLMRKSKLMKKQALNLTGTMLESKFPVDMWNGNEVANDLVTNFIFWALDNDARFTRIHKLVIYTIIYRGFDGEAVAEISEKFGAKDNKNYEVTPEVALTAYDEVANIFERHGETLLNKFLNNAKLDENSNKTLIPNYSQILHERSVAIQDSQKELLNADSLGRMDAERIALPETALDLFLTDVDFILLQSGNITARNKTLVRLQRLIRNTTCKSLYGRNVILHYGVTADFNDMTQETDEECLRFFSRVSVSIGGYIVYIRHRIRGVILREAFKLETILMPSHVHEKARYIENHPDESDEEVATHFSNERCKPESIAKIRANFFYGGHFVYRKTCTDEPINNDSDDTRGDFLEELSVPAEALDRAEQREIQQLSRAAIAELPPYHRFLLEQYFLRGKSFREIGEMIGVKRQAIEPVISKAKKRLKNEDSEEVADEINDAGSNSFNLESDIILMKNRKAFGDWCLSQYPNDKKARDAFKAYLGLDKSVGYRRLKGSEMYRYLERGSGRPLTAKSRVRISNAVLDLKEELRGKLLSVLPEERFLDVVPERIMYRRAREHLKRLRDGSALS